MKMTVKMEVSTPQALALQAMFEYWNLLSSLGGSREVGFYVDGDGDFHPKCEIEFDEAVPELTNELKKISIVKDEDGNRIYDYDSIAWKLG